MKTKAQAPIPAKPIVWDRAVITQRGSLYNKIVIIRHWPQNEGVWVTILHPTDKHELSVPRSYLREVTEEDIKSSRRRRIGQEPPKLPKVKSSKKQVLGSKGIDACWEMVKDLMKDPKKYQALRDKNKDKDESDQRKAIRRILRGLKK